MFHILSSIVPGLSIKPEIWFFLFQLTLAKYSGDGSILNSLTRCSPILRDRDELSIQLSPKFKPEFINTQLSQGDKHKQLRPSSIN